jgi:hypothetical protein
VITNIPVLGIRFDIDKVNSGSYGFACWKLFWAAVPPGSLCGAKLYEGDTAATLNDAENVFCIAVQTDDEEVVSAVKRAVMRNDALCRVAASPWFVEGVLCTREPLVAVGTIDASGTLRGDAWNARPALESLARDGCQP